MTTIRVDTDLLLNCAEAIHLCAENFQKNGETLLNKILGVGGEYAGLTAQARRDAYAAWKTIRSVQNQLEIKAEGLAALARAFRSIDDETISNLLAAGREGWILQTFFSAPFLPDFAGFEPCFVPQTWILLSDWVPVYVKGSHGLTQTDTYHTGKPSPNPMYGQLVPGAVPATQGRAAHWVTVTDVFQDEEGKIFVQVFNPYSGCEEAYSWDTFVKTCQQPGTQVTRSYSYIEAALPAG